MVDFEHNIYNYQDLEALPLECRAYTYRPLCISSHIYGYFISIFRTFIRKVCIGPQFFAQTVYVFLYKAQGTRQYSVMT